MSSDPPAANCQQQPHNGIPAEAKCQQQILSNPQQTPSSKPAAATLQQQPTISNPREPQQVSDTASKQLQQSGHQAPEVWDKCVNANWQQ